MLAEPRSAEHRVVFRGGIVVTGDPRMPVLRPGDVFVRGDTIEAVLPHADGPLPEDCQVVDASRMIVMPGLIDSHRHLWQTAIRGLGADLTNPEYRDHIRFYFGPPYQPDDVYASTLAGALEAIENGITTVLDWAHIMNSPAHADASLAALEASGIRAVFAYGVPNDAEADSWWRASRRPHPQDIRRIHRRFANENTGLVSMAFAARSPHLLTHDVMVHDWSLARELGLRIAVDGGLGGGTWGPRHYPIRLLREAGLLGDDTTYIHCNNLADDEYAAIAASGGAISMSPCAEMHVGHGLPATGRALAAGIRPALSLDYVTQVGGDLFGTMRSTLATERGIQSRDAFEAGRGVAPWELRTSDVLEFATVQSAKASGLGDSVGTLAPGKQADIVLLNAASFRLAPVNDPVATIVLYATPADVDTVMIAGRIMKRHGRLLRDDAGTILEELEASRGRLFARAGLRPGQVVSRREDGSWGW